MATGAGETGDEKGGGGEGKARLGWADCVKQALYGQLLSTRVGKKQFGCDGHSSTNWDCTVRQSIGYGKKALQGKGKRKGKERGEGKPKAKVR